jgi:hypothetical protein
MTKATKTKRSGKAKPPAPARRKPGRPLGSLGKKTIAMREACASVYEQLQEELGEGRPHGHFFDWAKANPTEFYRLAVRMLPLQIETNAPAIGVVVFRGIND